MGVWLPLSPGLGGAAKIPEAAEDLVGSFGEGAACPWLQPPRAVSQLPRSCPAMEGSPSMLDAEAVADLVLLDPLTEESLVQTLQERFRRHDIYVGSGTGGLGGKAGAASRIRGLRWGLGRLQGLGWRVRYGIWDGKRIWDMRYGVWGGDWEGCRVWDLGYGIGRGYGVWDGD